MNPYTFTCTIWLIIIIATYIISPYSSLQIIGTLNFLQSLMLIPLYSGSFQRGKDDPPDTNWNQPNGSEGVKNIWGNRRQSNKWITIFVAVVVILITLGCFLCFAKWIKHKAEGK